MTRLNRPSRIDTTKPLTITFGGQKIPAFAGDTLASALLAADQSIVSRSFKYHRPRGIYAAGAEEPNALVQLRSDARQEPNAQTTQIEAFDGLTADPQNAWPSLDFDIGAVNNLLSPFFSAGFYYKTFIGPFRGTKFWMQCESAIRRAAGMGVAQHIEDPDHYEKRSVFCDLLVIGGGGAGLSAALAAGRAGAKVILAEQDFALGGTLLSEPVGTASDGWLDAIVSELQALPNVTLLTRTMAFGAYDGDTYGLVEKVSDHLPAPAHNQIRQRYWLVHAKRSILASGAHERPLIFGGNDLPGVMLAGAVRTYLNRYAVLAGRRCLICTNNDSAYALVADLVAAGASVTLVDLRAAPSRALVEAARATGTVVKTGHGVLAARGRKRVQSATIVAVDESGKAIGSPETIAADVIAVSGGWAPAVHLWSQLYRKPAFDIAGACFIPDVKPEHAMQAVGGATGSGLTSEAITQGFTAGTVAALACGISGKSGECPAPLPDAASWREGFAPIYRITRADGTCKGKAFIDLQHDVKVTDIEQAHLEGYVSVEHLKRYTTTGMATDQGKLSNVNALTRMAELRGIAVPEVGTTTFRPPFTPITIGTIVGHETGRHFRPVRRSMLDAWHQANGATMAEAGAWMRPWYYGSKSLRDAYIEEAAHVREHVGIVDVSTLGKIAVQGPDAAEFLNRVYTNGFKKLAIGRLRYGVMLREDGFVMDDGATARLGETDYFMSTTTANAAKVLAYAEKLLQSDWRDLRVHVTSVTDQWAAFAVAGPKARALLSDVVADADLSAAAMPNNHFTHGRIADVQVRIHRMSYSGELAYEIYVPAGYSRTVWQALIAAGGAHDLRPYGTEAMGALRIEKGHVAGAEIEGRTTLRDLGLEGLASSVKPFIGSVLRKRPVLEDPERPTLVGLAIDGPIGAKAGSLLFAADGETKGHGEGWVSSTTYSPALGQNIALALLARGRERIGETIRVVNFVEDETLTARVVSHHFYDPEGKRQNA